MYFMSSINNINYILRRYKKSKTLRIKIKQSGEVLVTAPYKLDKKYIDSFITQKSEWIQEKLNIFATLPPPDIKTKKEDYKKFKEEARKIVIEKINKINQYYNFSFGRISIRDQKTRWGSCSNKKNLNFNYKIVFIPDRLAEYIVAHELCHLKEMNHGQKFWDLVSKTIPDYQKAQSDLKKLKIK